jgi:hypothetical protein
VETESANKSSRAVDPIPDIDARSPEQLADENLTLRARIEQLEALLTASHIEFPEKSADAVHPEPPEDIVTTFEGLRACWGRASFLSFTVP